MLFAHRQSMVQRKRSFVIQLIYSDFKMRMRHRFPLKNRRLNPYNKLISEL
jgi:hypothetical protein